MKPPADAPRAHPRAGVDVREVYVRRYIQPEAQIAEVDTDEQQTTISKCDHRGHKEPQNSLRVWLALELSKEVLRRVKERNIRAVLEDRRDDVALASVAAG